jgi:hypothetical protein
MGRKQTHPVAAATLFAASAASSASFSAELFPDLPWLLASVATAIADVFRNNEISVGRDLAKILKIFEKIDENKSRGVI